MPKRTLAFVLAAGLAFGSVPAPAAAADTGDLGRVIAGALILGLIAKAVEDQRDSQPSRSVTINRYYTPPAPPERVYIPAPQVFERIDRGSPHGRPGHPHTRPGHPHYTHATPPKADVYRPGRTIPGACARTFDTRNGPRTFVGRACLKRDGIQTADLPARCQRELDLGGRDVNAWNLNCLKDAGYRVR